MTSRMVKSPSTASSPSFTRLMPVDWNERDGYFSTSKKSALFRCASRWASRVSDGGSFNQGLDSGPAQLGFVQGQRTRNLGKLPFYVGDHHVLYLELGSGMGRINVPGCGCSGGLRQ